MQTASDAPGVTEAKSLADVLAGALRDVDTVAVSGRVSEAVGTLIKASGVNAHIGEVCELRSADRVSPLMAEVVGFSKQVALLTPFGDMNGISATTEVVPSGSSHRVLVGEALLGRILDGFGVPMDGLGKIRADVFLPVYRQPPNPLDRQMINEPMLTGVRTIDAFLTIADGQRVGIFAPAGVGKSTLLGMLARGASCDVNVIALIGERGREVREFIEHSLGSAGMAKSVVVVATSDKPAMERAKAAYVATTIAEYFRDRGKRVLLLMDSITRFARAQREIGLASGEPPTRRGFPSSIFAVLPQLLERAGQGANGSITAFYSVLTESDDVGDPIAEEVRSILDGHIVLSRKIAALNQYPAIDVLASLSRVMPLVTSRAHQHAAGRLRSLMAKHQEIELLLRIGEYKAGGDELADEAVEKMSAIRELQQQETDDLGDYEDTIDILQQIATD